MLNHKLIIFSFDFELSQLINVVQFYFRQVRHNTDIGLFLWFADLEKVIHPLSAPDSWIIVKHFILVVGDYRQTLPGFYQAGRPYYFSVNSQLSVWFKDIWAVSLEPCWSANSLQACSLHQRFTGSYGSYGSFCSVGSIILIKTI